VLQESVVLNRAYAERFGVRLKLSAEPPRVLVTPIGGACCR
jgi:hypothetical protein